MKNVIKLSLVLLTSLSLSFSAYAGSLEVSGSAKATYNIAGSEGTASGKNTGKGIGITNELNFTAAGELDNGWSWNYSMELDPGSTTSTPNDDTKLTMTTPYGTVGAFVSEGGMDATLKFSPAAYDAGIDVGTGGVLNPIDIGSFNNLQYHTPADLLPYSTTVKVGYSPAGAGTAAASGNAAGAVSTSANTFADVVAGTSDNDADFAPDANKDATEVQLYTSPVDGLDLYASYIDVSSAIAAQQQYEAGAITGKYTIGAYTIGLGRNMVAPFVAKGTAAGAERITFVENTDMGIGYAINDNLSVSYEVNKSEAHITSSTAAHVMTKSDNSQDVESIQAAYTMGGMTLALSYTETDGDNYTKEESTNRQDVNQTIFAVTMAF
jgi:hypothetical protein